MRAHDVSRQTACRAEPDASDCASEPRARREAKRVDRGLDWARCRLPCGKRAWNWEQLDFIPPDDDADACQIPQALVTTVDDREWIYLISATQIGSKKHDGVDHYEYHHIWSMRRPVENSEQAAR